MSPRRGGGGARRRSSNKLNASDKPKLPRDKKGFPAHTSSARLEKMGDETVRLNKYLADHGVASRRKCDELIAKGKVMIDDQPVNQLGIRIDPRVQKVEIDGVVLKPEGGQRRYYLLNKPSGVVCTNEQREMRPRAIDMIHDRNKGRIYTVGRLDEDSKGLIILTNDGEFAQRIAHPRHGVIKTYRVRVQGNIPDESVQKVREGVYLSDGRTGGARILVQRRSPKSSTLLVSIHEGKNREIRRIFARVGYKVVDLIRTDIGPLNDRGVKVGHYRALTRAEVEALLHMTTPEGVKEAKDERESRRERTPDRGRATTDRSKGREAGRSTTDRSRSRETGRSTSSSRTTSSPRRGRGGARRRRR